MKNNRLEILILVLSLFFSCSCNKEKPAPPLSESGKREKSVIPVIKTDSITEITRLSAVTGGELVDKGNARILSMGVCWNTSPLPTIENHIVLDSAKSNIFTSTLSQLSPNTVYYVRAFATNIAGIGYGNELTFTTYPNGNFMKATVNGIPFIAYTIDSDSWLYYSTTIRGITRRQHLYIDFGGRVFKTGTYPLEWIHPSGDTAITATFIDLTEMINPEEEPIYHSETGTINITQIDTGTYLGSHAVFINLEATFNFFTDSWYGKTKKVENGIVSYHVK